MSELKFPVETWEGIFDLARPSDILSLSETCRALHNLISRDEVWIRVLRRMCDEKGLFMPSYDFKNMDIGQLQRAALGPDRWSQFIKANRRPPEDIGGTVKPSSAVTTRLTTLLGERIHCLVPGGRYLVTVGPMSSLDLELFDLGTPGTPSLEEPILIVRTLVQDWSTFASPPAICFVGNSIRLGFVSASQGQAKVYEVDLSESCAPRFELLGTLSRPGIEQARIFGDCLLILPAIVVAHDTDWDLTIWNFKAKNYTLWTIKKHPHDRPNPDDHPHSYIFRGDLLILFFSSCIKVVRIPEVPQRYTGQTVNVSNNETGQQAVDILTEVATVPFTFQLPNAIFFSNIPFPLPLFLPRFVTTRSWNRMSGSPLLFDVFFSQPGYPGSTTASRYRLDIGDTSQSGDIRLNLTLLETFSLAGLEECDLQELGAYNVDSTCVLTSTTLLPIRSTRADRDIRRYMTYSVIPRKPLATREGVDQHEGVIDLGRSTTATAELTSLFEVADGRQDWSLCPASGRLVYQHRDEGFFILDYLS